MSDRPNPTPEQPQGQTRREFIRKVLLTTAYATPAIVSLSVAGVSTTHAASPMSPAMSPMSPMDAMMRMMSPMQGESPMRMGMGNPGNMWK